MADFEKKERVKLLRDRCATLYSRMANFPDRPSWQLEALAIVVQLAELLALLDSQLATTTLNLDGISQRVQSLETKYSELLYHLSTRT